MQAIAQHVFISCNAHLLTPHCYCYYCYYHLPKNYPFLKSSVEVTIANLVNQIKDSWQQKHVNYLDEITSSTMRRHLQRLAFSHRNVVSCHLTIKFMVLTSSACCFYFKLLQSKSSFAIRRNHSPSQLTTAAVKLACPP